MATLTVYSNTGGDGEVDGTASTSWSTIRDATTGTANSSNTEANLTCSKDGSNYNITRLFFPFDTSSLPAGATITAATLSLYESIVNTVSHAENQSIVIVESTQAAGDALVNNDYDNFNTTELATRLALADVIVDDYNDFALNAAGLAMINKTGYTKFCVRLSKDFDNSAPTTSWDTIYFHTADKGTTYRPRLVITYTLAGVGGYAFFM